MKDCFIITAYCDTDEKISHLNKCISSLKKYDIDICIYSHFEVPFDVQKTVNFCIYDSTNPIITMSKDNKCVVYWIKIFELNRELVITNDDFGYAVINQWKNSINFLDSIEYDNFFIVNYDVIFTESFFKKNKQQLSNNDAVFYYFDDFRNFDMNTMFFSIKKNFSNIFLNSLTRNDYINTDKWLETYISEKVEFFKNNFKIVKNNFSDYGGESGTEYSTELSHSIGHAPFINHNLLSIFGGINSNLNLFEFIFFDIKDDVKKIEIFIQNKSFVTYNSPMYSRLLYTSAFNNDEMINIINDNKLIISINDNKIDDEIIKVFIKNTIKNIN